MADQPLPCGHLSFLGSMRINGAPAADLRSALVYDGDCGFCERYADYVSLRNHIGLALCDAREHPQLVAQLCEMGIDVNDGMVLILPDRILQGVEAASYVTAVVADGSPAPTLFRQLAQRTWAMRPLYWFMKQLRRVALGLAGRRNRI